MASRCDGRGDSSSKDAITGIGDADRADILWKEGARFGEEVEASKIKTIGGGDTFADGADNVCPNGGKDKFEGFIDRERNTIWPRGAGAGVVNRLKYIVDVREFGGKILWDCSAVVLEITLKECRDGAGTFRPEFREVFRSNGSHFGGVGGGRGVSIFPERF